MKQTGTPTIILIDTQCMDVETAQVIANRKLRELQEKYARVDLVNVFTAGCDTIAAAFVVADAA
jgi:hypothetical protein